jgi:predicted DCC family thiol-disulfide oxidoreductase YuxK
MKLRLFYDATCPLCAKEIGQLKALDQHNYIEFQNIYADDFEQRFPHIDPVAANTIIHGELADGSIIKGLDVTYLSWKLVGKNRWLAVLRWPVIRIFADFAYTVFAKHRYTISYWLTGQKRLCDDACVKDYRKINNT